MPRYFFDIMTSVETVRDDIGVDASGPDEVLDQAWIVIAELASEQDTLDPDNDWTLVIRDTAGSVVGKLPLS